MKKSLYKFKIHNFQKNVLKRLDFVYILVCREVPWLFIAFHFSECFPSKISPTFLEDVDPVRVLVKQFLSHPSPFLLSGMEVAEVNLMSAFSV